VKWELVGAKTGLADRHEIASVAVDQRSFWKMVTVQRRGPNGERLRAAMMPGVLLADSPESVAADIRAWQLEGQRY
jgi:alkanesulfonate monooxygenase SsuD/methylene tetrahydromethanopterin reductase-like flavin-dependent oxidoreductase (luciferase family)